MSNILDRSVVFAVDFKPRIVGGLSVMPNHGRAGGAPAWLTLGNGSTASTIPVPLAGYGASFTGTQYVNTGVVDRYRANDVFSLYGYYAIDTRYTSQALIGSFNNSDSLGVELITFNTTFRAIATAGSPPWIYFFGGAKSPIAESVACTFAPSSVTIYQNSKPITLTTGANNLGSSNPFSGKPYLIGATHNGAGISQNLYGRLYAAGIFDGLLTPRDIPILDTLVRGQIR